MKYRYRILNAEGNEIKPVTSIGSPAEHFAFCVDLAIDLLNDGDISKFFKETQKRDDAKKRELISKLLPGGTTNKYLLSEFNKTLAPTPAVMQYLPVLFISTLHEHPAITPKTFLVTWENKNLQELNTLLHSSCKNTEKSLSLFLEILRKIKIPGVHKCIIETIAADEKLRDNIDRASTSTATVEHITVEYPQSSHQYVLALKSAIGTYNVDDTKSSQKLPIVDIKVELKKENSHYKGIYKATFPIFWIRQLSDSAKNELASELKIDRSKFQM